MQDILITVVDFGSKKLSASLGKRTGTEVEIIASQNVPSKGGIKKGGKRSNTIFLHKKE